MDGHRVVSVARLTRIALLALITVVISASRSSAQSNVTTVSATDLVFEDRVEVSWAGAVAVSSVLRIERDGDVIGAVASDVKVFDDTSADPLVSYQYCIIETTSGGADLTPVCDNGARAFFAPTGVIASDRLFEKHVLVSWTDRSQRESEYRVGRSLASASSFTDIVTLPANASSYRDTTAVVGIEYTYSVTAYDANGFSTNQVFDNGERAAVTPPAAVDATDGQFPNFVRITWTDQSNQEESLNIYRDAVSIASVAADTTQFDDVTAVTGVTYNYCVASVVGGVESVQVCDDGMRGGLRAPSLVDATDDTYDDRVVVTWSDDADTEDGFEVYRRLLSSVDSELIATRPVNSESYSDRGALQSEDYEYCVRAFSNADPTATSYSAFGCDDGRRSSVLAPEEVGASDDAFEDRVEITWQNPSTTVTLFKVYRDGALIRTLPATTNSYFDEAIASDTPYTYEVSAMTVVVTSAAVQQAVSAEVAKIFERVSHEETQRQIAVAQETAPPPTPGEIEARANTVLSEILQTVEVLGIAGVDSDAQAQASAAGFIVESAKVADDGSRSINAPESVDATYDDFEDHVDITWVDNSSVEKGYRVYRQAVSGPGPVELVGEVSASRASLGDFSGVPGVEYTYSVRAYDDRGPGGESAAGEAPGRRTLKPPTDLSAADGVSESAIELTWTDNSRAEAGYRLVRDDGKVDSVLAPQSNRFMDTTDLVIGKTYEYVVSALDAVGSSEAAADSGSTAILSPAAVNASDVYTDRVRVVWDDRSMVNDGYRIRRTSAADFFELTTIESVFTDLPADRPLATNTDYTYCIAAYADDPATSDRFFSAEVCDTGRRPGVEDDGGPEPLGPQVLTGGGANDQFGRSVAVHSAGLVDLAAIGAPGTTLPVANRNGKAYLYGRAIDGTWSLDSELLLVDGAGVERRREYGFSVDIGTDYAVVGDPGYEGNGRVSVFSMTTGFVDNVLAPTDAGISGVQANNLGYAVAIDSSFGVLTASEALVNNGTYYSSGAAFATCSLGSLTFVNNSANGLHTRANVSLGNNFELGYSVDIAKEYAIVGVPGAGNSGAASTGGGNAYIFRQANSPCTNNGWALESELFGFDVGRAGERAGEAVAISDGFVMVGAPGAGSGGLVYAYRRSGSNWLPLGTLEANRTTTGFGKAIAIYQTTDLVEALVGAPDESGAKGAVYAFRWDPIFERWDGPTRYDASVASLTPTDGDEFGKSVAIGNGYYVIGAPGTDVPAAEAGSAIIIPFDFEPVVLPSDLNPPTRVSATDGTNDDRIQLTWKDETDAEEGYRIYRSAAGGGLEVYDEVDVNVEVYNDVNASAGASYQYCVAAIDGDAESLRTCDVGWRPPNGVIGGRVAARSGAGIADVSVCPFPSPNQALLFDGQGGFVQTSFNNTLRFDSFSMLLWLRTTVSDDAKVLSSAADLHPLEISGGLLQTCVDGCSTGTTSVSDGNWHSVAVVGDPSNIRVFLDGVLEITHAPAGGMAQAMSGQLLMGKNADADGSYFNGAIDEVQIWNVARTIPQIQADHLRALSGSEDGLVAYWALDQGARNAAPDITRSAGHGLLQGGVYWTGESAPLQVCQTTDLEGNYELTDLRYGTSRSFTITPSLGQRSFDPAFKKITLSTGNPVQNEVGFTDASAFTISGEVLFSGTECPVEDVEFLIDDVLKGTSESDGTFRLAGEPSADSRDKRHVVPQLVNSQDGSDSHEFIPSDIFVLLDDDVSNIDFVSTKTRTLSGMFGGSCSTNIGTATLRITTENGCFEQEVPLNGAYSIDLPPQKYLVEVVDVNASNGSLAADIVQFFDDLGAREVDLTLADQEVDFIYRAPLSVAISGFSAPPAQCSAFTIPSGQEIPAVPILSSGLPVSLIISVTEDYGNSLCPVDTGSVRIFDELADDAPATVLTIENGVVQYQTVAGTPVFAVGRRVDGVDRSFQKSITAVAQVEGKKPVTETEWVVVEGMRARSGTFVSATTDAMPFLILRDPPGGSSSSFLEKESKYCSAIKTVKLRGAGGGLEVNAEIGFKSNFIAAPFGVGTSIENGGGVKLGAKAIGGRDVTGLNGPNREICVSTSEKFSTPSDVTWVGEDLFLGAALNLVFAEVDVLDVDPAACVLNRSEELGMDINDEEPFETTYLYGATHIKYSLIPELENLKSIAGDDAAIGDIPIQRVIDNWQAQLGLRDSLTALAMDGDVKNRSFSSGADYEFSEAKDTTTTVFAQTTRVYLNAEAHAGGVTTIFGFDLEILAQFEFRREWVTDTTATESFSSKVGYALSDGDTGDFFSVDVGTDPVYGTPVFKTVSGRSSNPWEANTQRRDYPKIDIFPPIILDADPTMPAVFQLALTNDSESQERREYVLDMVRDKNPGSAVVGVTGDPIGEEPFLIEAGETKDVLMSVERGPVRYNYDSLAVIFYPKLEREIWEADPRQPFAMADTAWFSVHYTAPCSPVEILRPKENWSLNASTIGDSLEVILHKFDLDVSETDAVQSLGLQYRLADTADWLPAVSVQASLLDESATSWTARWLPQQDGAYEVRAYTQCPIGGNVYSDVVPGVVDTTPPAVFGAPEPGDEILALGDDIAITFSEVVACGSVDTEGIGQNTTLKYVDGPQAGGEIEITPVCDGRTVILNPADGFDWTQAENRLLQVDLLTGIVDGQGNPRVVSDLVGNPIANPITWQFTVQRSSFTWSPTNLAINILGETTVAASLVNGRAQEVSYSLTGVPGWLSPSRVSGVLPPGGTQIITFDVDVEQISTGMADTVAAQTSAGDALLYLNAVCELDGWEIEAARFQYSMSVTGQLFVEGVVSSDPDDRVAAFVGNELRGVANVSDISAGSNRVNLTVYSNNPSSETVLLRAFDASACRVPAGTDRTFTFVSGSGLGTPEQPIAINATDELEQQTLSLAAGWTWFSTNREAGSTAVADILSSTLAAGGDLVKSQTAFSVYDSGIGSWVGTLEDIEPGRAYLIKMANANTLVLGGPAVNPASTPVDVVVGWNWIGYLPQAPIAIDEALASLSATATTNDIVKSQYQFAQYDGSNWVGSLTQMDPGLGYLLKVAAPGTIVYPTSRINARTASLRPPTIAESSSIPSNLSTSPVERTTPARKIVDGTSTGDGLLGQESGASGTGPSTGVDAREDGAAALGGSTGDGASVNNGAAWLVIPNRFTPDRFSRSMTVTAEVEIDGASPVGREVIVAAFVGDELRGVAEVRGAKGGEASLAFMMVYGDDADGESVTFRIFDAADGRTYETNEKLAFVADAVNGTPGEPQLLSVGVTAARAPAVETLPTEFSLAQNYPNPFSPRTTIRYELPTTEHVQITLFDMLGREVRTLVDDEKKAGQYDVVVNANTLASGMYVYRIVAGSFRDLRTMVVLK